MIRQWYGSEKHTQIKEESFKLGIYTDWDYITAANKLTEPNRLVAHSEKYSVTLIAFSPDEDWVYAPEYWEVI